MRWRKTHAGPGRLVRAGGFPGEAAPQESAAGRKGHCLRGLPPGAAAVLQRGHGQGNLLLWRLLPLHRTQAGLSPLRARGPALQLRCSGYAVGLQLSL